MTTLPHDIADVMLAPVSLHIDERIEELGTLTPDALAYEVAVRSDLADRTGIQRKVALLATISRTIEMHGWRLDWDVRGVRLRHGTSPNTFVLGVPEAFRAYVQGVTGAGGSSDR